MLFKKILVVTVLLLSLNSYGTGNTEPTEVGMCDVEKNQCEPTSCFDECIKEGEDPLECPYYCYDQV